MSIRIDAYVLLRRSWRPDFDAVAAEFEWRYPQIGRPRLRRSQGSETQATMVVEGAPVEISVVGAPYPPEQLHPPLRTLGHDAEAVERLTAGHAAYVVISTFCEAEGLELACAHAALVTLVASVVAAKAEAMAVMWPDSWACMDPEAFEEAAASVLRGQPPLNLWLAFAHSNPAAVGGAEMTGIASLGLRTFLGRELELAPMPSISGEAIGCMREAARRLLSGEWLPHDFGEIALRSFATPLGVRLAEEGFLRRGVPAIVLVAPDAAVELRTLQRKTAQPAAAAGNGGLFKRIFKRG
ncbi:hypothetical protein M1105_18000 [Limibaculum sp. FT325]|uniref:hypothetical protein n=1 Tax=Thermohalobaculum sediminis TaxID=2939436 RepID=UPI0020C0AE67|nr:hypothetical protein [Limibaculum sediminis]MCL5778869.1 hypothetical protein [Limibaculum sediminis]